jgi:thymidine kinase
MFSGKTEELIRRLNRAKIAKQEVVIFKPTLDNRYHAQHVISHNANAIYALSVERAELIWENVGTATVIGIDEVQFFDDQILEVCNKLANMGRRVVVAGLDMDYTGKPFGCMPQLMASAEFVTKVHAICVNCGDIAHYSHRIVNVEDTVLIGETDSYQALCRRCFVKKNEAKHEITNDFTQNLTEILK